MNEILGVAGLAVSVLGFGVTIWQLVRTANAAEATTTAVESANKRMLLNHLLVLLPQLKTLEADLDTAIATPDKQAAIRALIEFSHAANQVASLLESQSSQEESGLIAELRLTAKNASANKAVLVSGGTKPLGIMLRAVAIEIGEVTGKCVGLSTKYQAKVA